MERYLPSLGADALRHVPAFGDYDVVVIGGGPAGIAASTTAAELGHRTLLVERLGYCGGAAVSGMSGTICGLYLTVDEPRITQPQQVVFGFAERFRAALEANGGVTRPQIYGKSWVVTHDCATYKRVATDLVRGAGVDALYHTQMIDVIVDGDALAGLVLLTKSGFTRVERQARDRRQRRCRRRLQDGAAHHQGERRRHPEPDDDVQDRQRRRAALSRLLGRGHDLAAQGDLHAGGARRAGAQEGLALPDREPGEMLVNATKIVGFDGRALDVTDPVDHTEAEQFGIYQARAFFSFLKETVPGCENAYFIDYGAEVGVRQTRSIDGVARLMNADVVETRKCPDAIARSSWPIELHQGAKPKTEWLVDDYYEVPFGTLVPREGRNVIVAGRCLSAEHEALASCRVTAQCFEYGRAAAIATDLSIRDDIAFREIDGVAVAQRMAADGAL